jgi:hypothetical protein
MHCSYSFKSVRQRTWTLRPATVSSESESKNGTMEAMSNEGPHIRDYKQKSEMLWNEGIQKSRDNTEHPGL